jgi:RluA family pseudouridine synthase
VKKSYKIGPEETVEIYFRDQRPQDIVAEDIPLDIRYEDEYLLVVNKPAGMVTHPAHGNFSGTLVNALMHYFGRRDEGGGMRDEKDDNARLRHSFYSQEQSSSLIPHPSSLSIRPGIVHRLDKGTSGLLVVAKNEYVHRKLTEQFSAHEVQREYRAIVWGRFKANEGTIDAPLGRHPGDRLRYAVVRRGGKHAVTTYRVEESYRETSYLSIRLKTGRTHQIRVHLSHEGHPIFGDADYGGRHKRLGDLSGGRKRLFQELLEDLERPALHARTLGFVHPMSSESLLFTVEPPEDFCKLLKILRKDAESTLDFV